MRVYLDSVDDLQKERVTFVDQRMGKNVTRAVGGRTISYIRCGKGHKTIESRWLLVAYFLWALFLTVASLSLALISKHMRANLKGKKVVAIYIRDPQNPTIKKTHDVACPKLQQEIKSLNIISATESTLKANLGKWPLFNKDALSYLTTEQLQSLLSLNPTYISGLSDEQKKVVVPTLSFWRFSEQDLLHFMRNIDLGMLSATQIAELRYNSKVQSELLKQASENLAELGGPRLRSCFGLFAEETQDFLHKLTVDQLAELVPSFRYDTVRLLTNGQRRGLLQRAEIHQADYSNFSYSLSEIEIDLYYRSMDVTTLSKSKKERFFGWGNNFTRLTGKQMIDFARSDPEFVKNKEYWGDEGAKIIAKLPLHQLQAREFDVFFPMRRNSLLSNLKRESIELVWSHIKSDHLAFVRDDLFEELFDTKPHTSINLDKFFGSGAGKNNINRLSAGTIKKYFSDLQGQFGNISSDTAFKLYRSKNLFSKSEINILKKACYHFRRWFPFTFTEEEEQIKTFSTNLPTLVVEGDLKLYYDAIKKAEVDGKWYEVLGLPIKYTEAAIRRALNRSGLRTHPDKNPHNVDAATKIQAALNSISDYLKKDIEETEEGG